MRRTASWSTRDAFTDGHLAEVEKRPGLRTKAATSRAHAFRKFGGLSLQRSSSDAQNNSTEARVAAPFHLLASLLRPACVALCC